MNKFYQNKSVVVTGHTGFKGSWLVAWLKLLGANVTGIALDPPSSPNHFNAASLANNINDLRIDIRDLDSIKKLLLTLSLILYFIWQPSQL